MEVGFKVSSGTRERKEGAHFQYHESIATYLLSTKIHDKLHGRRDIVILSSIKRDAEDVSHSPSQTCVHFSKANITQYKLIINISKNSISLFPIYCTVQHQTKW